MAYTKWVLEPDSLGKYGVHNIVTENGELITSLLPGEKTNAQLIVSAVNGCIQLNPDNPQALSESISDFYEALKAANITLTFLRDRAGFSDGSIGKRECSRAIALNKEALAKAKEK